MLKVAFSKCFNKISLIHSRIALSSFSHKEHKEVFDLRKPDKKAQKHLMQSAPTRTMIIHPVFYPKF